MVERKAYGKINLSLDVLRRREDGYHEVKMIMQAVDIYDVLTFEEIGDFSEKENMISLEILNSPADADLGPIEKNLIYRATQLIMDEYRIKKSIKITLNKHIPVAAGMAGGSTDAAAVFHGLNEMFGLNMSIDEMCRLGVKLGADIPYCIMGGTALAEGIGQILTPITAPPEAVLVIAKPDINVSTKYVYENLHANSLKEHPDVDGMIASIEEGDLKKMGALFGNVLENVTVKAYPVIEELKTLMKSKGAVNSLMSGSGPTVFGIWETDKRAEAEACAKSIIDSGLSKEVFVSRFIDNRM